MTYLLDTNMVVFVLKNRTCAAAVRFGGTDISDVAVCSIVEGELYHGATKYGNPARRVAILDELLAPYHSFSYDSACVPEYARIRDDLERRGCMIGGNDLLIAAIALTHDLKVITNNGSEFRRVTGLRVEDWSL